MTKQNMLLWTVFFLILIEQIIFVTTYILYWMCDAFMDKTIEIHIKIVILLNYIDSIALHAVFYIYLSTNETSLDFFNF